MANLNNLVDPSLGHTLLFANSVNARDDIYGEALDADGRRFLFLAQAVPEPRSWALMILGFALASVAMRRHPIRSAALSQG